MALLVPLIVVLLTGRESAAQSYTWNKDGGSDNWSTAGNWTANGGAPGPPPLPGPGQALIFAKDGRINARQDRAPQYELNSITFTEDAPEFVIYGANAIRFSGDAPAITVNSTEAAKQRFDCPLELNADTQIQGGGKSQLEMRTAISEVGGRRRLTINLTGGGGVKLETANSFSGGAVLKAGELMVMHLQAFGPNTSTLTLNGGVLWASGLPKDIEGNLRGYFGNPVTIGGDVTFGKVNEKDQDKLNFTATITLVNARNTLTVNKPARTIFRGKLVDSGRGIVKDGDGMMILGDPRFDGITEFPLKNDQFTGPITVKKGTIYNNSDLGPVPKQIPSVAIEKEAKFKGKGTVNCKVVTKGEIQGGDGPGILTINDDLVIEAGGTLDAELDGPIPGGNRGHYSQLRVNGNVTIDGAVLRVVLDSTPSLANRYVILQNDGTNPISGTFTNLPEGAVFDVPSNGVTNQFQITYAGNRTDSMEIARDIVITALTAVPVPQPTLSVMRSGDQVTVWWPEAFNGYTLEKSSGLGWDWEEVILTGPNRVTFSAERGTQFFKLNRL
jgi:hypothetical protein